MRRKLNYSMFKMGGENAPCRRLSVGRGGAGMQRSGAPGFVLTQVKETRQPSEHQPIYVNIQYLEYQAW